MSHHLLRPQYLNPNRLTLDESSLLSLYLSLDQLELAMLVAQYKSKSAAVTPAMRGGRA
jgi:hypothetical protein